MLSTIKYMTADEIGTGLRTSQTGVQWIDLINPETSTREQLQAEFNLLVHDVTDAVRPTLRSKISQRNGYLILVLLMPIMRKDQKQMNIEIKELDFFLTPKNVITIHDNTIPALANLWQTYSEHNEKRQALFNEGIEQVLAAMLFRIVDELYPLLDQLNETIEDLKNQIFSGQYTRKTIQDILITRRNIIDVRRAVRGHTEVLQHLVKQEHYEVSKDIMTNNPQFEQIVDYAYEIWTQLESLFETIEALKDANESLLSHDLNDTMQMLTVLSVILLPAGVVAGIFGMNAQHMPWVGLPGGFWLMLAMVVLGSCSVLAMVRLKKWL